MLYESGDDSVKINAGMRVRAMGSVALALILAVVGSGCGKEPAGESVALPVEDEVAAVAAPEAAAPEVSSLPVPAQAVVKPQAPPAEPVDESRDTEQAVAVDAAAVENAQVVESIIERRERGDFAGARNLAIRALERDLPAALVPTVEMLLAESQRFAREAPDWQAAIELLTGDRSEQRIARNTLLRGGQGAAILMNRALRQASGELFSQLVELLDQQRANQVLPIVLKRYSQALASGADTTREHSALMALLPSSRPDLDLTSLEALAGLLLHKERELFGRQTSESLILYFTQDVYHVMQRAEDAPRMAQRLVPLLRDLKALPISGSLRIRMNIAMMDCAFLAGDYAGALEILDAHTDTFEEEWQAMVRNKLKAHLAEQAQHYEEAITRYRDCIEGMNTFFRTGIENPEDGSMVCREFVLGLNEKRIGDLWAALPDGAAESEAAYARARVQYQAAVDKMKGDHDNCYYRAAMEALATLVPDA